MGLDAVILPIWILQILIVIVFIVRRLWSKRWLSAIGFATGLMIGFSPIYFFIGPAVWKPFVLILEASIAALLLLLAFQMRWVAFAFVLLIFAFPQVHALQAYNVFSYKSFSSNTFLKTLDFAASAEFFFVPLVCAFAFAEIFDLLDRFLKRQKQA